MNFDIKELTRKQRGIIFAVISISILVLFGIIQSPNKRPDTTSDSKNTPAYEQFQVVFKDAPSSEEIGKLMDAILDQYNLDHTEIQKQRFGSALYSVRSRSAIGVTEMQVMKYMYQHPHTELNLPTAIATAATILEKTQ